MKRKSRWLPLGDHCSIINNEQKMPKVGAKLRKILLIKNISATLQLQQKPKRMNFSKYK